MIENLVSNYADHFEGLLGGDRVNQHVAMNADEVLRVEYAVLVLQERVSIDIAIASLPARNKVGTL